MISPEQSIDTSSVICPGLRPTGLLTALGVSIRDEGLRHPITLWNDGTLLSGSRRYRVHMLLGGRFQQIRAVYVDTIEDAAKCLLRDNEDEYLSLPWKPSEMCRFWELMRRLDEPAANRRMNEARRRGVVLRRQTQAGKRPPGRLPTVGQDYILSTFSGPFGLSGTTAKRLWAVYSTARSNDVSAKLSDLAAQELRDVDSGDSSIWSSYQRLLSRRATVVAPPRPVAAVEPAAASRQLAAWNRALPQLEGLASGLTELGPPNAALTWDQVGPVAARLAAARRDLEKIINEMRKRSQA